MVKRNRKTNKNLLNFAILCFVVALGVLLYFFVLKKNTTKVVNEKTLQELVDECEDKGLKYSVFTKSCYDPEIEKPDLPINISLTDEERDELCKMEDKVYDPIQKKCVVGLTPDQIDNLCQLNGKNYDPIQDKCV